MGERKEAMVLWRMIDDCSDVLTKKSSGAVQRMRVTGAIWPAWHRASAASAVSCWSRGLSPSTWSCTERHAPAQPG